MPSHKVHSTLTVILARSIPAAKRILADLNVAEAAHYLDDKELHDWACTYLGKEVVQKAQELNPNNPVIYVSYLRSALLKANRPTVIVYTTHGAFSNDLINCVDLVVNAWDESLEPVIIKPDGILTKLKPVKTELEFYIEEYVKADAAFVKELRRIAVNQSATKEAPESPTSTPELRDAIARSLACGRLITECGIAIKYFTAEVEEHTKQIVKEAEAARACGLIEAKTIVTHKRVINVSLEFSRLKIASYFDCTDLNHVEFYKRCVNIPNALHQLVAFGEYCKEDNLQPKLIIDDSHDRNTADRGTRIGISSTYIFKPSDFSTIDHIAKDSNVDFLVDYFYFINTL